MAKWVLWNEYTCVLLNIKKFNDFAVLIHLWSKDYWFSITALRYGKTCLFILLEIWINRWNNNYCKYCIAKKSHCCSFDYENMIFDSKEYLVYQLECRLSSIVVPYFTNNLIRFWSFKIIRLSIQKSTQLLIFERIVA